MADSYTTFLRLIQMATGSNNGLWGDKENSAVAMIEQAIAGSLGIDLTTGDHVLTTANNATDEARNMVLSFNGTPGVTRTVTFPNLSKLTMVICTTDAPIILTAGAGFSAALVPGQVAFVLTDGATNLYAFILQDIPGHSVTSQVFSPEAL